MLTAVFGLLLSLAYLCSSLREVEADPRDYKGIVAPQKGKKLPTLLSLRLSFQAITLWGVGPFAFTVEGIRSNEAIDSLGLCFGF